MILCYYWFIKTEFIIQPSNIHGNGLFSTRSYKKGDIIIDDLFPNKNKQRKIKYVTDVPDFDDIIILEGKYINHCSKNFNSTLVTKDYKRFYLIATKNIPKNKEITANYDKIHKRIPFIANSNITHNNHFHC